MLSLLCVMTAFSNCARAKAAVPRLPNIDNARSVRLSVWERNFIRKKGILFVAEHIRMTAEEAKQKAEGIRKVILDTYHREVEPSPFFTDLRAGTLSKRRL